MQFLDFNFFKSELLSIISNNLDNHEFLGIFKLVEEYFKDVNLIFYFVLSFLTNEQTLKLFY
jgi:hypothetical protein